MYLTKVMNQGVSRRPVKLDTVSKTAKWKQQNRQEIRDLARAGLQNTSSYRSMVSNFVRRYGEQP